MGADSKPAVPSLLRVLQQKPSSQVVSAFGWHWPGAADAIPELIRCLKQRDATIRSALLALRSIGPQSDDVIPAIIELLEDNHVGVRNVDVRCIGQCRTESTPCCPLPPHFSL